MRFLGLNIRIPLYYTRAIPNLNFGFRGQTCVVDGGVQEGKKGGTATTGGERALTTHRGGGGTHG